MGKKAKKGYEGRYCPKCERKTYFDGNECQVCHYTFSTIEIEQGQDMALRIKSLLSEWKENHFLWIIFYI